jgi:hypothetical protein
LPLARFRANFDAMELPGFHNSMTETGQAQHERTREVRQETVDTLYENLVPPSCRAVLVGVSQPVRRNAASDDQSGGSPFHRLKEKFPTHPAAIQ